MTVFDAAFAVVSDAEFTAEILSALGIDPDMPVETLQRRLLWGERVEQCVLVGGVVETGAQWWEDAGTYWQWLVDAPKQDSPDSAVTP